VLAGWVAQRMGVPIERLVVASNQNDIVHRWIATGVMQAAGCDPTFSPSMDIVVSSNVERLLFELNDRDGGMTAEQLRHFRASGRLVTEPAEHRQVTSTFASGRADDAETLATIARVHRETGLLVDPHTAVALAVADSQPSADAPLVTLATAHPAKFPDAVRRATGITPPLPPHLADLLDRPERIVELPNDVAAVQAFVSSVSQR
jgi:threonine synthase